MTTGGAGLESAFTEQIGAVVAFDEPRGLGELVTADGTRLRFHATQIGDGSRRITLGMQVSFVVVPGSQGAWEAGSLRPV